MVSSDGGRSPTAPVGSVWDLRSSTHSGTGRSPEQQTPAFPGDEKLLKAQRRRANCAWLQEDVTKLCEQRMKWESKSGVDKFTVGQLLPHPGGLGLPAPLGMRQFHESMQVLLPLEQEFPRCLQQELTPHQPCGAGTPTAAALATHVGPELAFAAKIPWGSASSVLFLFCSRG